MNKQSILQSVDDMLVHEINGLETFRKRRDRMVELIAKVPDGLPEPAKTYCGTQLWPLYMEYPADLALKNEIETILTDAGFEITDQDMSGYALTFRARHPGHERIEHIYFEFETGLPQSTCVIEKIGEKTIETIQPIYDVRCA
jgi:hypothetical protein